MKLLIDIPESIWVAIQNGEYCGILDDRTYNAIKNGTPLDRITAEIDRQEKWLLQAGYTAYNVDIAFDAIKAVLAEMR